MILSFGGLVHAPKGRLLPGYFCLVCLCFGLALAIWQAVSFQGEPYPWCGCPRLEVLIHFCKQSPVATATGVVRSCLIAEVTQNVPWALRSVLMHLWSAGATITPTNTSSRSVGPGDCRASCYRQTGFCPTCRSWPGGSGRVKGIGRVETSCQGL